MQLVIAMAGGTSFTGHGGRALLLHSCLQIPTFVGKTTFSYALFPRRVSSAVRVLKIVAFVDRLFFLSHAEASFVARTSHVACRMLGVSQPRYRDVGLTTLKFFPAELSGGCAAMKLFHGPFPHCRFIPTGCLTLDNIGNYLATQNVLACGGSFCAPAPLEAAGKWEVITQLCQQCRQIATTVRYIRHGRQNPSK